MADVTGGDLYALWRISEVLLPRVADVYYDTNRALGGAGEASSQGDSFRPDSPAYPGGTVSVSAVGAAWDGLRSEMQAMTELIGSRVLEGAEGVRLAIAAYDGTDWRNSGELAKYLADENNHDPSLPQSNPPVGEDAPGEPYPN